MIAAVLSICLAVQPAQCAFQHFRIAPSACYFRAYREADSLGSDRLGHSRAATGAIEGAVCLAIAPAGNRKAASQNGMSMSRFVHRMIFHRFQRRLEILVRKVLFVHYLLLTLGNQLDGNTILV